MDEVERFEKGSYRTTSTLLKIVFGLSVIAFLLHIVGFFAPYWSERDFVPPKGQLTLENTGLWKMCRVTLLHYVCVNTPSPGRMFPFFLFTFTPRHAKMCFRAYVNSKLFYVYT